LKDRGQGETARFEFGKTNPEGGISRGKEAGRFEFGRGNAEGGKRREARKLVSCEMRIDD
jgi:hypothetical protein